MMIIIIYVYYNDITLMMITMITYVDDNKTITKIVEIIIQTILIG